MTHIRLPLVPFFMLISLVLLTALASHAAARETMPWGSNEPTYYIGVGYRSQIPGEGPPNQLYFGKRTNHPKEGYIEERQIGIPPLKSGSPFVKPIEAYIRLYYRSGSFQVSSDGKLFQNLGTVECQGPEGLWQSCHYQFRSSETVSVDFVDTYKDGRHYLGGEGTLEKEGRRVHYSAKGLSISKEYYNSLRFGLGFSTDENL